MIGQTHPPRHFAAIASATAAPILQCGEIGELAHCTVFFCRWEARTTDLATGGYWARVSGSAAKVGLRLSYEGVGK